MESVRACISACQYGPMVSTCVCSGYPGTLVILSSEQASLLELAYLMGNHQISLRYLIQSHFVRWVSSTAMMA